MLTHLIKRDRVLIVCWGWTAFTAVNLFYPPLIIIQLGVIWGTYFALKSNDEKNTKISELEELSKELPSQVQRQIEIVSTDYKRILSGIEHFEYLHSQVRSAKTSITILSGWLSSRVVDACFVELLESKLERGLSVHIGYGWQDSRGEHNSGNDSREALASLGPLARMFPNQLYVAEYATHEKILVIDSEVVVFGSANWLSNKKYKNSERSIVVTDSSIAQSEETRISRLVRDNRVI